MANALAGLRDIHLPSPISWWPIAPGYWIITLLFLFLLLSWRVYQNPLRRIKREALQQLARYQQDYEQGSCTKQTAAELSTLLRQVALIYYPRSRVASLQGDAWLAFLSETSRRLDFEPVRHALLESPFRLNNDPHVARLFPLAKAWIKQRGKRCLS